MKFYRMLAAVISSLAFCSCALADVIYENGEFNGTIDGAQITPPQSISNSFTVGQTALITSATVGLWSPAGSEPETLTWSIGTTPFGTDRGTGTVSLLGSNDLQFTYPDFYVYLSTFSLNVQVEPGEYYFTLSNGFSTGNQWLGWDINFGPSAVFFRNAQGEGEGDASEYFLLEGTLIEDPDPSPVPEPSSLLVLAAGAAALRMMRPRQR